MDKIEEVKYKVLKFNLFTQEIGLEKKLNEIFSHSEEFKSTVSYMAVKKVDDLLFKLYHREREEWALEHLSKPHTHSVEIWCKPEYYQRVFEGLKNHAREMMHIHWNTETDLPIEESERVLKKIFVPRLLRK